jgi:hypothetical protein
VFEQMRTVQKLPMQKLHLLNVLAGSSSKVARMLMFTISALLILASSFVPVYTAEPAATGFSPMNFPGTGNAIPYRMPSR